MSVLTKAKQNPRLGLILLAFIAFVALGLPDGLLGVGWPSIRAGFGVPLDAIGLFLTAATIGYMTSSFLSGWLLSHVGIGRVLAASCDTLMGMASRTLGFQVTTLEINMNYIRSVKGGEHITGVGQVIHHGRKTIVVECECYDASGNIIVKGRSSFYILKKLD